MHPYTYSNICQLFLNETGKKSRQTKDLQDVDWFSHSAKARELIHNYNNY